jgi:hypothetical protein
MVVMVMMMMVVVMVVVLRYPFTAMRLCCGDAGIIHLQGTQCIQNRL